MLSLKTRQTALTLFVLFITSVSLWYRSNNLAASGDDQRIEVFMPILHIRSLAPTADLRIVHMGLYQSVQDATNGISLVAGKPALLRVYAQAMSSHDPDVQTEVTVRAYRDNQYLGSVKSAKQPVPIQPTSHDFDSTFNIELPLQWLHGRLDLIATIDDADWIPELNENNNSAEHSFTFQPVPPLNLTIVPIIYNDTRRGITYQPTFGDPISDWLHSAYPVAEINVSHHAPYHFTGDLSTPGDWQRLLEGLTSLWAVEKGFGSPELFFGLIPTDGPDGSWFQGGIAGLGWIGQRVAIGLDLGDQTAMLAAHEIGHNFGRRHAPCGNPNNVDPNFPYPDGSIGVFGIDTQETALLHPNQARDFMSYCGPEWVSDYTYEALVQDQLTRGARSGVMSEGLLVRARLENGGLTILPTYQYESPIFPVESVGDLHVQIVNSQGDVVSNHPATLLEAEENGVTVQMVVAHIPSLLSSGQSVQIVEKNQVLAKQSLAIDERSSNHFNVRVKSYPDKAVVHWDKPGVPALVRYLPEGSESWSVLAVDVTGGYLEIDTKDSGEMAGQIEVILADGGRSMAEVIR
jgi:hypothetical protein